MNTTNRLVVPIALGMEERVPQPPDAAELIQNMTFEPRTRGWDSRIGYETYFPIPGAAYPLAGELPYLVESVYCWTKYSGAQQFLFAEGASTSPGSSTLYLIRPPAQINSTLPGVYALETGRPPSAFNDYSTQYIPAGDYLIVLNGVSQPMKLSLWPFDFKVASGESPVKALGFQGPPAAPSVWGMTDTDDKIAPGKNVFMRVSVDSDEGGIGTLSGSNYIGSFNWRVTFVSETGSESPLSPASSNVDWDSSLGATTKTVCLVEVPTGPKGTVARRIYRTKDMSDGMSATHYFVGQLDNNIETVFFDHVSDTALGAEAPSVIDSVRMPAPKARFGAMFNNCLFLDGGANATPGIVFSNPGKIDQFSLLDFMEFGSSQGGSVTALHSHYNALLVFRERSIESISGSYPAFASGSVAQGVGCVAPGAVVEVPALGVMFVSHDGIYLLHGGFEGGSKLELLKISDSIDETWRKVNVSLLNRTVAEYSPKWREVHFYLPSEGEDRLNLGIVYHMDKQCFSVRKGFPVNCLTVTPGGDFVFGHNKGKLDNDADETGLFVISRTRHAGYSRADANATPVATPAVLSKYHSPAHDFGAGEVKKFVKYVYLYAVTHGGNNEITLRYCLDDEYQGSVTESRQLQRADHPDQEVIGSGTYDSSIWEKGLVTEIRFPIPEKGCSRFQFQLDTQKDLVLIGYTIDYTMTGTKIITGQSTSTIRSRA
jgi:hypothetical protein